MKKELVRHREQLRCLAAVLTTVFLGACAHAPKAPDFARALVNSTLWVQTSAEYRALALAAYEQARRMLDTSLEDTAWTAALEQTGDYGALPPAVILDLDETVLDNAAYEAWQVHENRSYGLETWAGWCRRIQAKGVPGAVEFIKYAHAQGVTPFFVTNRDASLETVTRKNLADLGVPLEHHVDTILMKDEIAGWGSDKSTRRAFVARTHRVLLLVGDDLGDFVSGHKTSPDERVALLETHRAEWGRRWIILPNPMYGSWETSIYGHDYGLTPAQIYERKLRALAPWAGK